MDKTTEKKSEASENWHWRLQLSGSERDQKVERGLCWPPDRRHEEKPRAWPAHRLAGPGPRLDRRTERQKPSEKKDRRKPTGRDQFGRKSRRKTRWKNRPRALTCEKEKPSSHARHGSEQSALVQAEKPNPWAGNDALGADLAGSKTKQGGKNDGGEVSAVKRKPGAPSARTELEALTDKTKLGGGQGVLSTQETQGQNPLKPPKKITQEWFCWSTNLPTTNTGEGWSTNRSNRLYLAQ
jgi:hypothetical protein